MITLKELAEKLDVSISTVSKALNDSPEISKLTIDRVKALANFYNYKPNRVALSLRNSSTKTIGVIIPSILNRFFAKVLFGIETEARKQGYNIITCMSNEKLDKEKECLQLLSNGSVDGFVVAVSEETQEKEDVSHFQATQNSKIPIVMFDRVIEKFNCDKVIINDFLAAKTATEELIKRGKKNIAFISSIANLNVGKLRQQGYIETVKTKALTLEVDIEKDSQAQIENFLLKNKNIDGIISADNISGTIVISIANKLGYIIPKEIAVVGFADEQISVLSVPKLSFVNQNAEKIGSRAIHHLINRLNEKETAKAFITETIETTFAKQGSF